ncbi:MAG TPA: glycine--tRNA ligase subunit beta, partial [Gammaproteobacteria bacterium]|nr:glycine--tRNA ligase subunit beta [Gammaproteobacteria bacterium]
MTAHHPSDATADLLFEIGTEELPPKALSTLSRALGDSVVKGLTEHNLAFDPDIQLFASPRRLGVQINALALIQPDALIERRGPPLARAFDDQGQPTQAAQGFARSCGVDVDRLERLETDKGAWLAYRQPQPGRPTRELLPALLQQALDQLPVPKRMHWNALAFEFVRPIHWAVLLLGEEVIDCRFLGIPTGRQTRGHRFHHPEPLSVGRPGDYRSLLADHGYVIADFQARREAIHAQVARAADTVGGRPVTDEALLDEVTGLVEWPVALAGSFDERFLDVPQEALISAMQVHQKCFPVLDGAGRLMPYFITVCNIDSRRPDSVRAGYERVIRPRLADADFFWNQDRRTPLAGHLERLAAVVFQERLGTLLDKSRRLMQLVETLAPATGADTSAARRGAELSKCDLLSRMVEEFPELQGTMGRYYAGHDGEPEEAARAIEEQYLPRFAGDDLPATGAGQALALADKLDTLVGVFAIGQAPTGDKDPFALRRAALGVIRIIIERGIDLDLNHVIDR